MNSLFIPIELDRSNVLPFSNKEEEPDLSYVRQPRKDESFKQSLYTDPRLTPSNIVSSSVFPRSASEALFDSSSKFRQLPCRTFISVGTCPYRERCVYLHDPRCICRDAKTKTRRKNKEDVVVDALFWPVMPYSLVAGKLDAQRQPHVIQSYSVPIPQYDTYRSHDQAVYSCWMHFVDFCMANNESQHVQNADAAPCYQAPDLPYNAYTEKERLQIFMKLSRMLTQGADRGRLLEITASTVSPVSQLPDKGLMDGYRHQPMTIPSGDSRNLQYPVLASQPARVSPVSSVVPSTPATSLLNLYAESNPLAHTGRNSAMQPYTPVPLDAYAHPSSRASAYSPFAASPSRAAVHGKANLHDPSDRQYWSEHHHVQQQERHYSGSLMVSPPLETGPRQQSITTPPPHQQARHQSSFIGADGYPNPSPTAIAALTSPASAAGIRKRFPAMDSNSPTRYNSGNSIDTLRGDRRQVFHVPSADSNDYNHGIGGDLLHPREQPAAPHPRRDARQHFDQSSEQYDYFPSTSRFYEEDSHCWQDNSQATVNRVSSELDHALPAANDWHAWHDYDYSEHQQKYPGRHAIAKPQPVQANKLSAEAAPFRFNGYGSSLQQLA